MVFVLVGRNTYCVTSTLADRDKVRWKYVDEQRDYASYLVLKKVTFSTPVTLMDVAGL